MLEKVNEKINQEIEKILQIENLSYEQLQMLINYKEYIDKTFDREETKKHNKAWIETMSKLPI